jgi:DNA-binding CsgD family transcriptional regulator
MKTHTPISKERIVETPIAGLLHDIAHKRAVALRWNTYTMLAFYALLIIVALMRLEGMNIFLVMGLASLGLLALWIISRMRWKKLEKKIFEEELENYHKIIALERHDPIPVTNEQSGDSPLSDRELEVLDRIAEGMINKQIAVALGISTQTVKNHISHILAKLDVDDRTSAVLFAVSKGWINLVSRDDGNGKKLTSRNQNEQN